MKKFLLDTNILLLLLRQDNRWSFLKKRFDLDKSVNFISVVSMGELHSIAARNQWGEKRIRELELLEKDFTIVDIYIESIIYTYGQIDAFSQGKLKDIPLSNSARNMGKNDLWIAASASVLNLELLTSDLDFDHLNNQFLTLHTIDIQKLIEYR